jgi:hypothetical protein
VEGLHADAAGAGSVGLGGVGGQVLGVAQRVGVPIFGAGADGGGEHVMAGGRLASETEELLVPELELEAFELELELDDPLELEDALGLADALGLGEELGLGEALGLGEELGLGEALGLGDGLELLGRGEDEELGLGDGAAELEDALGDEDDDEL